MKKWTLGLLALALCVGPASASSIGVFLSSYAPNGADTGEGFGVDFEFGSKVEFEFRLSVHGDLYTDADPNVYRIDTVPIDTDMIIKGTIDSALRELDREVFSGGPVGKEAFALQQAV